MELLQNRCSWENQEPSENRQENGLLWRFAFYNAPSFHAVEFRPFYANQSSELNVPIFLGKQPEFWRKKDSYKPLRTAMAQVLPFLNGSTYSDENSMTSPLRSSPVQSKESSLKNAGWNTLWFLFSRQQGLPCRVWWKGQIQVWFGYIHPTHDASDCICRALILGIPYFLCLLPWPLGTSFLKAFNIFSNALVGTQQKNLSRVSF